MAGNSNNEHESLSVTASSVGHEEIQVWLSMMHFSSFKGRPLSSAEFIANFFDKPKTEFLAELSGACDVAEARFVCDIMYSTVK